MRDVPGETKEGYEDSWLPEGVCDATPADTLECARGPYLHDFTARVTV